MGLPTHPRPPSRGLRTPLTVYRRYRFIFLAYYARMHGPWPIPVGETVTVPTGYSEFPREILRPPRSIAERTFTNIQRWSVMERGGHFAAMEQPDALAEEVRAFFRPLR